MAARKTSTFWYLFSKFWFWITGWHLGPQVPPGIKKSMMIAAPHTSNWDFMFARAAFFLMDVDVKLTIKKEWTTIPVLGALVRSLGGLAVDRSRNNSLVDGMVQLFNERDELVILITPEGTRKYQPKWRKGFYHAAVGAGVPILLGYLDYKNKEAGVGPAFWPTGDYEKDLEEIKAFYRTKQGRFPAQGIR
ncbi:MULTISPECIES: 1-acyl-sn-glycerol-3-phosphate acyltransferase [Hymenobacter]|uniref:1-acyl-sn-glycerol-3-phosphate acyltransferase n=2 Tax=Hymenobacter TaxID=89966 RepID=A0ABS6X5Y3_9BACT|nr:MULTISPECIES: 1-acyl-sn-glycerol-3-phosphate acyltransferase [Hymenobacter]MBO3270825.1 1-acyl-sn-glycerol-3-phosphate acyltransferase [Hymenobacter defluvii]MBW3130862.1 1-acyl-sn-glycerol-3-phosphate acyltransferase [Hymenobacter profundi]QNE39546.1 glycerol acyltransferase [Hymenobacter sp. NBH84]